MPSRNTSSKAWASLLSYVLFVLLLEQNKAFKFKLWYYGIVQISKLIAFAFVPPSHQNRPEIINNPSVHLKRSYHFTYTSHILPLHIYKHKFKVFIAWVNKSHRKLSRSRRIERKARLTKPSYKLILSLNTPHSLA